MSGLSLFIRNNGHGNDFIYDVLGRTPTQRCQLHEPSETAATQETDVWDGTSTFAGDNPLNNSTHVETFSSHVCGNKTDDCYPATEYF